jgi:hypothetical protein
VRALHCIAGVLGLALRRSMGALQGSDLDQGEVQQPCDAHRRERYTYIYMHRLFINYIVSHSDQRFGVVVCPGIDQPGNETLPFALYDKFRIDYFEKYLYELQCAIRDGANVFGYFAWSLLDNFEWRLGFTSKFGIVYVDRNTFVRYPKDSARWFRKVIKNEN